MARTRRQVTFCATSVAMLCASTGCHRRAHDRSQASPSPKAPSSAAPELLSTDTDTDEVLAQVERIKAPPEAATAEGDVVVEAILIPSEAQAHRYARRPATFVVGRPAKNASGTAPLAVGKFYRLRIVNHDAGRYRIVGYEPAVDWKQPEAISFELASGRETLTLQDLIEIRNAVATFETTAMDSATSSIAAQLEHATVGIDDGPTARIGVFIVVSDANTLRLDYTPRPAGLPPHDTFGFSAAFTRRGSGFVVTSIDRVHHRWR